MKKEYSTKPKDKTKEQIITKDAPIKIIDFSIDKNLMDLSNLGNKGDNDKWRWDFDWIKKKKGILTRTHYIN